jgi:hypothetical protein
LGKGKRNNKAREEGEKGERNSSRIEKTTMEWIKVTGPTKKLLIENIHKRVTHRQQVS